MISGQVFVRETGSIKDGKKIFIVVGIIGIDKDDILPNEHQFTISNLKLSNPIDRKQIAKGNTPDGLLNLPIWRI